MGHSAGSLRNTAETALELRGLGDVDLMDQYIPVLLFKATDEGVQRFKPIDRFEPAQ